MKTLREHRHALFISIEDLAKKAGVSTKTIVDTELGRTQPKFRTIRKISEALGIGDTAGALRCSGTVGSASRRITAPSSHGTSPSPAPG